MTDGLPASGDQWDEMAKVYEKLTVGTAVKPIGVILERSNALWPFSKAEGILDNGCGPGPIMSRLLKEYKVPDSCTLTCSDFSDGMIKAVQKNKEAAVEADSSSPWSRMETVVQDAMDLKSIADGSKSHITAGWVRIVKNSDSIEQLTDTIHSGILHDGRSAKVSIRVQASPQRRRRAGLQLLARITMDRPDEYPPESATGEEDA